MGCLIGGVGVFPSFFPFLYFVEFPPKLTIFLTKKFKKVYFNNYMKTLTREIPIYSTTHSSLTAYSAMVRFCIHYIIKLIYYKIYPTYHIK